MFDWLSELPSNLIHFMLFVALVYGLKKVPIVGKYISVYNTLIHEVGHALAAIFTGGRVNKIKLFMSAEGVAQHQSRFWLGTLITSFAGYPTSSATTLLFIYFIVIERYDIVLMISTALFLISFIFWVRNTYGMIWLVSFSAIFASLLWLDITVLNQYIVYFLTAILFVESIRTAFEILILSFKSPNDAGDATSMWKSAIIIPPQLWGLFFYGLSLFAGYLGIQLFLY